MKSKTKIKSKYFPKSEYDMACGGASTYRGTLQRSALKNAKKQRAMSGGAYSSYKILDQLEKM